MHTKRRSFAIPLLVTASLGALAFLHGWINHREEYAAFWIVFVACCLRTFLPAFVPGRLAAITYANDIMLMCVGFILGFWSAAIAGGTATRSSTGRS